MAIRPPQNDGNLGEELARITTDAVRWHKGGFTDGDKVILAEDRFETELALAVLLANQVIFLNTHHWMKDWPEDAQKTTALCVSCSNVFAWESVDAEEITIDQLQTLYDMWLSDRNWGPALWCAIKRNQLPQPPVEHVIRKAGIWDLDALRLGQNWTDAEIGRMSHALRAHIRRAFD